MREKSKERIHQLQKPQTVAMNDLELAALCWRQAVRAAEQILQRPQHQRQRGPELVADVGEEDCLCVVDFSQGFRPAAFLRIGARVIEAGRDLSGEEIDKAGIGRGKTPERVNRRDHEPGWLLLTLLREHGQHGILGRRAKSEAADQNIWRCPRS